MLRALLVVSSTAFVPHRPLTPAPARAHVRLALFDELLNAGKAVLNQGSTATLEDELLACAGGKAAIGLFEKLEGLSAPPADLLTSSAAAKLDGRWVLETTVAAQVGTDDLEDAGINNAVNASGIVLDTSKSAKPVQEIDLERQRIGNEIGFALPLGLSLILRVAGDFRPDVANARRAIVEFDTLDVFSDDGRRLLRAGGLFTLIRRLRPSLADGDAGASWLETTYLSDRMRLGRGNKGSIFVLSRADGEAPLREWPL